MKVYGYGLCDLGALRGCNEDHFLVDEERGLFMVADGMRGSGVGIPVSQLAIQNVQLFLSQHREIFEQYAREPSQNTQIQIEIILSEAIKESSAQIYGMSPEEKKVHGTGTTLTIVGIFGNRTFIAHVGDTRVYLLRAGELYQLTEDHTLLYEYLKQGLIDANDLRASKLRKIVTRAVGLTEAVQVDFQHFEVAPGDRFLLCSDGLHLYLTDQEELKQIFDSNDLAEVPDKLVTLANQRGGEDNICAVVFELEEEPAAAGLVAPATDIRFELELLHGIPFFAELEYAELLHLHALFRPLLAQPGEVIIQEESSGDDFYILISGEVAVSVQGSELARLDRGSSFGEMALIDRGQRSASVIATQPSMLMMVNRPALFTLMRKDPSLAVKVLWSFNRTLSKRLRKANDTISSLADEERDMMGRLSAAPVWGDDDKPFSSY
jgi:serine/threonine protein phosphatase PrpC